MGGAPGGVSDPGTIQLADGYKYLGSIWISHDLTFNKHVEKVVMPSLRDSLRSLRASVATIDVLSPTTAMAIVRTLAEPRATYGSEIWARIDTGGAPRSLCRVTQASMLGIEKEFRLTLGKFWESAVEPQLCQSTGNSGGSASGTSIWRGNWQPSETYSGCGPKTGPNRCC